MPRPTAARSITATALAGVLAIFGLAVPSPAVAAETYSAPLATAVQQLTVAAEDNAGYDRDVQFGSWIDVDGDCQSTRHEVLVVESQVTPALSSTSCTVTAGTWTTIYDGLTYSSPGEVDIDHLVPVAEAWGSGARAWSQDRRVAFYNDLGYGLSLNAMASGLNQSKSAKGPEEWLPPADVCLYVEAWTAVKIRWALSVDPAEQAALRQQADSCSSSTVTVELAAGTVEPTPTPPPPPPTAAAPVPDQPGTKRLAGADRYSTAAAIVQDSFPSGPVPVVFIATGEAFADALAGGPAADVLGGPVLPVAKAGIPAPVLGELDRLDPDRIVILGGVSAVSDAIAAQLQGYTRGAVTRVDGANRYATAADVALSGVFTAPVPQVLIATGLGFADALAGGAVGALTDSPVLLVAPDRLPAETAAALSALAPRDIAVLGGTSAVSDAVLEQLRGYTTGGVNRLAGPDRYSTAARLAQVFWPSSADVVYLATGRNFPDALAGVPAAGLDRAPLLLVEPTCMPTATRQELDRLQPTTVVVLGGPTTVTDAAVSGTSCAPPPPAPPPTQPTPPPPTAPPARPADRDCTDFATQAEAQAFHDFYFPYYGDFARLDGNDDDGRACESLP